MMYKNDWLDFTNEVSWFIHIGDIVKTLEPVLWSNVYKINNEFEEQFQLLTKLLLQARLTKILINNETYDLLAWTDSNNKSFGWLCKPPVSNVDKPLCSEHKLLLKYFGGITERWNENDESWLVNLNSALTYEDSKEGFQGWETYIEEACKDENLDCNLNPSEYISFAFEANGNLTMYNKYDSNLIMFAHDHAFDHITPLNGFPDYTLYKINECSTFVDWVNIIAKQNLNRISI